MVVRKAVASDAPKIAEVNIDTWRTAYQGIIPAQHLAKLSYKKKEKLVRDIITAGDNRFILVAELETGEITGFTGAGPERNGSQVYKGEIHAIYVRREYQGRGIGRSLFREALNKLAKMGLCPVIVWVLTDNPYRRFYESLGGTKVGDKILEVEHYKILETAYGFSGFAFTTNDS